LYHTGDARICYSLFKRLLLTNTHSRIGSETAAAKSWLKDATSKMPLTTTSLPDVNMGIIFSHVPILSGISNSGEHQGRSLQFPDVRVREMCHT
jgi:hypothetical protein